MQGGLRSSMFLAVVSHLENKTLETINNRVQLIKQNRMIKYLLYSILILVFLSINLPFYGQNGLPVESDTHIFWQPDRKLTMADFQGEPKPGDIKFCEEKGYCAIPCLGIFVDVDIPKNYRRNKLEKVYFSPAFEKDCSYVIKDNQDIRDAQLLFDMAELSSRIGRKLLRDYHNFMAIETDSMNFYILNDNPDTILITGVGTSLAWRARDSARSFYQEISDSYIRKVYLSSEKESYDEWRSLVDDLLKKFEVYATKPEECYRMVKKQPIISNYKEAYK
jgi:hypothetical protein